jgi:putative RNA 2'-phosphotransferase
MDREDVRLSRFLSFVLRHGPDSIGLRLDAHGWVDVGDLIRKAKGAGRSITREDLARVVENNDKKRFSLSPDGRRIRADQGHSVVVNLNLSPREPPPALYHGTATTSVDPIMATGLKPQGRRHVHLSIDEETALRVGSRHGGPCVLVVDTAAMRAAGHEFYLADNGVWLTDLVPAKFLTVTFVPEQAHAATAEIRGP